MGDFPFSYPCPFCKQAGMGSKRHDCPEMMKKCWRCGEHLDAVALVAMAAGGRNQQKHQCAPVDMDTPGVHRVRFVAGQESRIATVMANVVFR